MEDTMATIGGIFIILAVMLFSLAIVALYIFIWWNIFKKTGYHPALALLMIVPVANLVLLLVLAFGEWPIQKELRELKEKGS